VSHAYLVEGRGRHYVSIIGVKENRSMKVDYGKIKRRLQGGFMECCESNVVAGGKLC
jgi:hypothetical protein